VPLLTAGGPFDPLGLAGPDADPEKVYNLKTAEIKHGRLAMIAFLGFSVQAGVNDGAGALGSAAKFVTQL
jgi:light-harvesting complex II chlorophyll a/b binding protein 4